ncbi:MAG: TatD family hydrolase [Acutalibacteraceae bacterium]
MIDNIFDSHAHYDDEQFDGDRDELLQSLPSKGVCAVINCASDLKSSATSAELSEKYPFFWCACGVHPHEAEKELKTTDINEIEKRIVNFTEKKKCVAIGEIGLDYHYDFSPRELQKEIFELQLKLSKELDLPVIVHDREAHEDTMTLLKKYRPKGVVHCFSGSVEMAREVLKLGMYIGLGGAVTFKNAKKPVAVAAATDIDRILLETDCPYMAPVPFRGTRCSSDMIAYSAQTIASVKNMDVQTLVDAATENTKRLFGIEF